MSKSIVLVAPVAALESRIAWRSEPGPLSAVLVTRKVDSSVRSSISSNRGRKRKLLELAADGGGGAADRREVSR